MTLSHTDPKDPKWSVHRSRVHHFDFAVTRCDTVILQNNTIHHQNTIGLKSIYVNQASCVLAIIQPGSTHRSSCRGAFTQQHIIIYSSSQESKHGNRAVTVMEDMLKSQREPMAWADNTQDDKASALQTDANCVQQQWALTLSTYGIINPQLRAWDVYLWRFLRTRWWLWG